jgi:hypothetical protein
VEIEVEAVVGGCRWVSVRANRRETRDTNRFRTSEARHGALLASIGWVLIHASGTIDTCVLGSSEHSFPARQAAEIEVQPDSVGTDPVAQLALLAGPATYARGHLDVSRYGTNFDPVR